MRKSTLAFSAIASILGAAALAHSGATGVVKERMDGMIALGGVVKELNPMMRAQTPFDAERVRAGADVMIQHAGEQMTRLFPEGSDGMPSEALPIIWEEWDEFTALAEQLALRAEGLKLSADVGLAASQDSGGASMMGGGGMMGSTEASPMGGDAMGASDVMTVDMFATMPTDVAFAAVAQSCAACHQKFRAEDN